MKRCRQALMPAILMATLLSVARPAHANLDFLEPAQIDETIRKQIAKQKLGASGDVVDVHVFDGLGLALKYKLQSEPSYVAGYYTRIDQYTFTADLSPGDIFDGLAEPLSFEIKKDMDVIFARQFKSQKDSLLAMPYGFKQFPITAERAIQNLVPGDFVAFSADLNLILKADVSFSGTDAINMGPDADVFVSGQFLVHVFRMSDNKVRLRLIAVRGKGSELGASLGLNDDFKVFGIKVVDRLVSHGIAKALNFTPLSADLKKSLNDSFMLDYVFDLNNAQAAQTYTDILTKKVKFKEIETTNPFMKKWQIEKKIITDISDAEEIAAEDKNKPENERRIDRVFKGSDTSTTDTANFKIGLSLLRFEKGSAYSHNQVVSVDSNENHQKYLLDTYCDTSLTKIFFGLYGSESTVSSNILFSTDNQWAPSKFVALTATREMKFKSVKQTDYQDILNRVKGILPASEFAKIPWTQWDFSNGSLVNGYFKHELFFHPEVMAALPVRDATSIYKLFLRYVEQFGAPTVRPHLVNTTNPNDSWEQHFNSDFRTIAKIFETAFNPANSALIRYNAFLKLKDFPIWEEHGIGFMVNTLPKDRLEKLISYDMVFSAKGAPTIAYKFGNFEQEDLYRSLLYIQNIITNQSFDLRLYTDFNVEFNMNQVAPRP